MTERWMIEVDVDPAPEGGGPDFDAWCKKWNFDPLNGGRRPWCGPFRTYLRSAYGVAETEDGEPFLVWSGELHPIPEQP